LSTSEPLRVASAEEPRLAALVVPVDNPFHAVTDEGGHFVIRGLLPGTYSLEAWDEELGALTQAATFPAPAGPPLVFSFDGGVSTRNGACRIAEPGRGPVGAACASGAIPAAKKLMKEMVKQAKAKGEKFTCDGCHRDLDTLTLTKNARDDFEKLLALFPRK